MDCVRLEQTKIVREGASQEMSKSNHEPTEKILFKTEHELNLELVLNHSIMHH